MDEQFRFRSCIERKQNKFPGGKLISLAINDEEKFSIVVFKKGLLGLGTSRSVIVKKFD